MWPGSVPARRCAGTTIDFPRGSGAGTIGRTGGRFVGGFERGGVPLIGGDCAAPGRGGVPIAGGIGELFGGGELGEFVRPAIGGGFVRPGGGRLTGV